MTNKELNQTIKNELKDAGYNTRDFSVSVKDCGYSTSIRVKIKNPEINRKNVENLLRSHEEYERDRASYEILEGGNTYLFIDYADGVFDTVAQEWAATARGAMDSKGECIRLFDGLYLINSEQYNGLRIQQQNATDHCSYNVYDFNSLCIYIYKFAKFGTISA